MKFSKTLFFHVLSMLAMLVAYFVDNKVVSDPHVLAVAFQVQAVVGIILRFLTNEPLIKK